MAEEYSSYENFLEVAKEASILAVDTETTGVDGIKDGRDYLTGIGLAFRLGTGFIYRKYFPLRHSVGENLPTEFRESLRDLITSHPQLVFHNAKFDMFSLDTIGIHIGYPGKTGQIIWDTMLMAHIIDENRPFQGKGLDAVAKYYLEDPGKKKSEEFNAWIKAYGWAGMPAEIMAPYGEYDPDMTLRLWEYFYPLMEKEDTVDYYINQKQKTNYIVKIMESNGITIDQELSKKQLNLGQVQMDEILEILGYDKLGPKALEDLLLGKLKLEPIYKERRDGTKTLTFDKSAMEVYETILERTDDPTAEYVLTYRGWQKTVSSNYRAYLDLISPDGRLRPNYKLHGTRTGRLSCEKPNLQQIPRTSDKVWNGHLKKAFVPSPGFKLWEADYGQLELRLGTAYAKIESLIKAFEEDRDVFTEMSESLDMTRQTTKTLTYTIQYGGGVKRLTQVFGVTPDRAMAIKSNFYNTYPGFKIVSDLAQHKVLQDGKLRIWSGRYRHFLNRKDEAHKGFNSVIQGGAADIVERTMIRLYEQVYNQDKCRMLLQVHDSVVFEIKEGLEDNYLPLIKEIMEEIPEPFGVKFKVEIKEWGK